MASEKNPEPVAVIGMGALFPQASGVAEYWGNITSGKDCLETVPESRWRKEDYFDEDASAPDKLHCRRGGFVPDVWFDPVSFGLPPNTLEVIDTAQLLALQVARETLDDAGYSTEDGDFDHRKTGVVLGVAGTTMKLMQPLFKRLDYPLIEEILEAAGISAQRAKEISLTYRSAYPQWNENAFPGLLANVVPGRISNRLNLGGVNFAVDAACGSSLCAVNQSVMLLQTGQCDMVITGGVDTDNSAAAFMSFAKTGILSPSGHVRSFDAGADGTLVSEGIGLFALKRVSDALRDGDRIYAQILGIGAASDGRSKSIYAPHKPGQIRALRSAYENAGILPSSIGLIEAHSPGTRVGDGIEVGALREVFESENTKNQSIALGSVKSQIGHTKAAAGAAGMMKAILSLHNRVVPPTLHVEKPNPDLQLDTSPFYLNTEARPWMSESGQVRRAGVNALGFGGTNYHTILEEAPAEALAPARFFFPDKSENKIMNGETGKLVFMFTGQGAQFVGMGRDLALQSPVFRDALEKLDGFFRADGKALLSEVLFPPPAFTSGIRLQQEAALKDTHYAQAALAAFEMAQFHYVSTAGLKPASVLGHSFGELTALWSAGAMDDESFLRLVYARGKALSPKEGVDAGTLLSVRLGSVEMQSHLALFPEVQIANLNAPDETVVGGMPEDIQALVTHLKEREIGCIALKVAAAFHTELIYYAKQEWQQAVQSASFSSPQIPVFSNSTAKLYSSDPEEIREQLAQHPFLPVRFVEQIENVLSAGYDRFIEIGPKGILSKLVARVLPHVGNNVTACCTKSGLCMPQMDAALQEFDLRPPFPLEETKGKDDAQSAITMRLSAAGYVSQETKDGYAESIAELKASRRLAPEIESISSDKQTHLAALEVHKEFLLLQREFMEVLRTEKGGSGRSEQLKSTMDEITRVHRDYIDGQIQVMQGTTVPVARGGVSILPERESLKVAQQIAKVLPLREVDDSGKGASRVESQAQSWSGSLVRIMSEKTGYPEEVIRPDMDLEADLGIDSIKRVEIFAAIQEEFNFSIDGSDLAELRTLGQIEEFFNSLQGDEVGALTKIDSHSAIDEAVDAGVFGEELSDSLIAIITEKTGYPPEVINPDMDLEADLGIDSIKRVEIFAAAQELLGVSLDASEFAEKRTVGEIAAHLALLRPNQVATGVVESSLPLDASLPESIPLSVQELIELPPASGVQPAILGDILLLSDGGRMALALAEKLEEDGCRVSVILSPGCETSGFANAITLEAWTLESLEAAIEELGVNRIATVLQLWETPAVFEAQEKLSFLFQFCGLIKPLLVAEIANRRPTFLMLAPENSGQQGSALHSCYRALTRTLNFEWLGVRVATALYAEGIDASGLLQACTDPEAPAECSLAVDRRWTPDWMEASLQGESRTFSKEDVFIVSGGGRGITASCIIEMCSRMSGGRFILLGRTVYEAMPNWLSADMESDEIKKKIVAVMLSEGGQAAPKEIELEFKKLISLREIHQSLQAIQKAGGEAVYCCVDIVDGEALKEVVKPVLEKWGEIKGIIHGAGVLADNLIEKLSDDDFRRVYQPKVVGLENLMDLASQEHLELCVLFSSVAAAYGNAGQSLYALANQVMNDKIESMQGEFPQAQVYSLNWGPWDAGMVTPALKRRFLELGIRTIPVDEGTRIFCDFVFMKSAGLGNVVIGDKITSPEKNIYTRQTRSPDEEEIALANGHVIAGRPVIPAAWAIQWMLDEAARYLPARQVFELRDLRVLNGVFADGDSEPYTIHLEDFKLGAGECSCFASILSKDQSGNSRVHYSCELLFLDDVDRPDWLSGDIGNQEESPSDWQAYRQGFIQYGEAFHGVSKLLEISESRIVTVIEPTATDLLFNPLAYDLATHGILIWLAEYHDNACLPSETKRYTQFSNLPIDQSLVVTLDIDDFRPPSVEFSFTVCSEAGQVLAQAEGLKMTLTSQPEIVPA